MGRAVIFDIGNVLIRWDVRLLYRQLLPDEAAIDAFLAEVGLSRLEPRLRPRRRLGRGGGGARRALSAPGAS